MARHAAALVTLFVALPLLASGPMLDRDARACFAKLLSLGGYGRLQQERAAFLVRAADGGARCVIWPATNGYREAKWDAPVPAGTFAIAHTHPRNLDSPSPGDVLEASRIGLPIFVITPRRVSVTDGGRAAVVAAGSWWRERAVTETAAASLPYH